MASEREDTMHVMHASRDSWNDRGAFIQVFLNLYPGSLKTVVSTPNIYSCHSAHLS